MEEFKIVAKGEGTNYYEEIDTAETQEDADYLIGEYKMAFGPGWSVICIPPNQQP